MDNIKLRIAYDGTAYLGWQKTPMGPSIESALQHVLEQILQETVNLQAASRTDAGVHAEGQIVNFFTQKISLDLNKLKISLNSLLPPDIAVLEIQKMPFTFHPTLDCKSKEYRYYINYGAAQLPPHRLYSWHYPHSLNLQEIQLSLSLLSGSHNFSAFCNVRKNAQYKNYIRNIMQIEIVEMEKERFFIRMIGNNFLYKMVRNLVGTLVYIGRGKIRRDSLSYILESENRTLAGMTAPAHGLFLHQVNY